MVSKVETQRSNFEINKSIRRVIVGFIESYIMHYNLFMCVFNETKKKTAKK